MRFVLIFLGALIGVGAVAAGWTHNGFGAAPARAMNNPGPCTLPPSSSEIVDPPNIYALNGVLNLRLTLTQQYFPGPTLALCWTYATLVNGKMTQLSVPPTLNVKQGERMSITLVNTLPPPNGNLQTPPPLKVDREPDAMGMAGGTGGGSGGANPWQLMCKQPQLAPTPTPDPVTGRIYGYHRSPWNEANLHFHGLNTSPNQPSDDVVNVLLCPVMQGSALNTYHYVVDIPRNEPPGLYWYHPHAHGESQYQVFMGLTGAIVVHTIRPSIPDELPGHLIVVRDTPALQGISKYHRLRSANPLQRQTKTLPARAGNTTAVRALTLGPMTMRPAAAAARITRRRGLDPFQIPDRCPGPKIPYNSTNLTVNRIPLPVGPNQITGLPLAHIGLGETQYYRLANTDAQTTLDLILTVDGKREPFMVTARDGVPLILKNGKPTYQPVAMNDLFIPPAGRVEFYMTGKVPGANMVVRTLAIATGCVGDTDMARNLFDVKVGTKQVVQNVVVPPQTDPVPERFSGLAARAPMRRRTFIFTEYIRNDESEPDFYLTETSNPNAIEHPYRMTGPPDTIVKDGTVEEWTFYNFTNEMHAFHIHQIHFMPVSGVTKGQGLGQMVDTVPIPVGGWSGGQFIPTKVVVLMDFREKNIVGTFVYHCHFLEHEDNGMMARIQVVP